MASVRDRHEQLQQLAVDTAQEMARAEALFLSIGDGTIATDEFGKIERVNKVTLSILGFEEDELIGRVFTDVIVATDASGKIIPEEDRPITLAHKRNRTVTRRCFYVCKNGRRIPVAVTVSPILLNKTQVGSVEVFRDISEEVELDAIKSDFISIASHELRTPATAVKTYLGMLLEGYAGRIPASQKDFLKMAYESNERQISILNDLLYVAKTESTAVRLKKKKVNFADLVNDVVAGYDETIHERRQNLAVDVEDPIDILVDPAFMRIVTENLLSNASKYTQKGGNVTVHLADKHDHIELEVGDNGVGIEAKHMDKLFKKFSRIDNSMSTEVGGSGIGLYLTKQMIDLHNGKITVKSKPGKGTVFTVKLPK
jgi:two-component system phosphate regulon sensor histidine kinase PhoR